MSGRRGAREAHPATGGRMLPETPADGQQPAVSAIRAARLAPRPMSHARRTSHAFPAARARVGARPGRVDSSQASDGRRRSDARLLQGPGIAVVRIGPIRRRVRAYADPRPTRRPHALEPLQRPRSASGPLRPSHLGDGPHSWRPWCRAPVHRVRAGLCPGQPADRCLVDRGLGHGRRLHRHAAGGHRRAAGPDFGNGTLAWFIVSGVGNVAGLF